MIKRSSLIRSLFLLIAGVCALPLGLSCGAESAAPTVSEQNKTAADAPDSGDTAMDEVNTKDVKITAAEAKRHSLPAAEITLDLGKTGLSGTKFPAEGEYLALSGPPGGPLGLAVFHIKELPLNELDWRKLIEKRYAERSPAMGKAEELEIAGGKHAAFTVTTDGGPAKTHHLLIAFAVPDSRDAIVVDFYRGGQDDTPSPRTLAADKKFSEISPSLSIRFE
jgi:hypothetical protein